MRCGTQNGRRTISDVARAAGVHPSTVSRALNRADLPLRPETRARVLAAVKRLGYRPSALARSLRLRRTLTLGMLVPDITNPLFPPIIKGAEDTAHAHGYNLILCNTEDLPEREAIYLAILRERQVDGLLIASSRMANQVITRLRRDGFPFVLVNRSSHGAELAVTVDNRAGAAAAIEHLVALGHQRIGHLAGPQNTTTGVERAIGVRVALRRLGRRVASELWVECEAYSEEAGYRTARRLLLRRNPPTAIFGANDLIALGALRAARDAGIRIPGDLSLVGFNDIPQAELLEPPLTTVRVPQYDMGHMAARMLIARLEGEPITRRRVVLDAALVVRASTAPPHVARQVVA